MNIRSITYFLDPGWPLDHRNLQAAGEICAEAESILKAAGYEIQTTRLATLPFPGLLPHMDEVSLIRLAKDLEITANTFGFEYISLGPALPQNIADYRLIPRVLENTRNVFLAGMMTTREGDISLPAVRACAAVIQENAGISPDGFTNLRFAALANVPAGAPFFPAAYHTGKAPGFSLAIEAAGLAVEVLKTAHTLKEARLRLIAKIEEHANQMTRQLNRISQAYNVEFLGYDFSLAPFPIEELSLGTAFEDMGVAAVGLFGSLAAAAFLTDALNRAVFPRVGFNGIFIPVLEDAVLATRAAEGILSLKDLLLYSAVCGTGLDVVPLPGDTTDEEIYPVLLDLAALAVRLDKPLTARLMPLPGKKAGDPTEFDFHYFASSRVMSLDSKPLSGLLARQELINFTHLQHHQPRAPESNP